MRMVGERIQYILAPQNLDKFGWNCFLFKEYSAAYKYIKNIIIFI